MPIINTVIAGGGTTPTGTKTITTNGTHDVTDYATADVQVPTTAPTSYRAFEVDNSGKLVNSKSTPWVPLPAGTQSLAPGVLYEAYLGTPANILSGTIDLSSLTSISTAYCPAMCQTFKNCPGITNVLFTNLSFVGGSTSNQMLECFSGCVGITGLSFPALTTVSSSTNSAMEGCFIGCKNLTVVDVPLLNYIGGKKDFYRTFSNCIRLTTMKFQSLTSLAGANVMNGCFSGCTSMQSIWFYALNSVSSTNSFTSLLSGVTGCVVHFPMAIQSTIGSWSDVTGGFGGTNTTVLFDLVTSLTGADTNAYTRSEKDSTATATAWTYNNTLYYTSGVSDNTNGVNEPAVGDTIYSDAACTTAVTTISAIA